jgi:hypothetical protein
MRTVFKHCWFGTRLCAGGLWRFLRWSLWLALVGLIGLQLWLASAHELPLPAPLLRHLERHIGRLGGESPLIVHIGRAAIDPQGRILVEDISVGGPGIEEPLLTLRLLHVRLDPWTLLQGEGLVHEVELAGLNLFIPGALSASGKAEPFLRDVAADFQPAHSALTIERLAGQCDDIAFSVQGAVSLASFHHRSRSTPATDWYPAYLRTLRKIARWSAQLAPISGGKLTVRLVPEATSGANAQVEFLAEGLSLERPGDKPASLLTGPIRLATRFPLLARDEGLLHISAEIASINYPRLSLQHLRLSGDALVRRTPFSIRPRLVEISTDRIQAYDVTAEAPILRLSSTELTTVHAELKTRVADAPLALAADIDWRQRSGTFEFETSLTEALTQTASTLANRNLARFVLFKRPTLLRGSGTLAAGAKLDSLRIWAQVEDLLAHKVHIDRASGWLSLHDRQFRADDAFVSVGDNEARGSYAMDIDTRDYRFLLQGRLRPLDINGWFGPWWPDFWRHFDFESAPPRADIDIQGRWGNARLSRIYVAAEGTHAAIREVPFDQLRTRLFIRTHYIDALDFFATQGSGAASGTFSRAYDLETRAWRAIDFDVHSTLDLAEAARLYGPEAIALVAPHRFSAPPQVHAIGHLDGPAGPRGLQQQVHVEFDSPTPISVYGLPLQRLALSADYHTGDFDFRQFRGGFAGGEIEGHAQLEKTAAGRTLGFDLALKHTDMGRTVEELLAFSALHRGLPPPARNPDRDWMHGVSLDLALSAEGPWIDLLRFKGNGNAMISGPNLRQIYILGPLSHLLPFTSLRFTSARSSAKIDGPVITFPDLRLSGSNSSIEASGKYFIDTQGLDFNARVYPFGESSDGLRGAVGFVLVPFSQALAVTLTGNLESPHWAFANGLSGLLRPADAPAETVPAPAGH